MSQRELSERPLRDFLDHGVAAEVIAALPTDDALPEWLDRQLYPFESHYVEIGDHRVHYLDEGDGPVLLMLHGNPTWSFLYRGLVMGLRDRFRCIAPDCPGFGFSQAGSGYRFTPAEHSQVIQRFVEALDLRDITMFVQDWGGPIGLAVAARHPERFCALVVGNTFAWPVNGDIHFEAFSKFMGGPLGRLLIRYLNAFVNWLIPFGTASRRLPRRVMAAYRGPFATRDSRRPTSVFPREITRSHEFLRQLRDELSRLRDKPTLVVWGARDFAFRAKERERFEQLFPRHQTVLLESAGHYIQEDAPDELVAAILEWWPENVGDRN